ncbi:DNA-protecting protein DprA [Candidatus Roizmanbacteria bacterium]|nr:DNA-protecting protein DprA [Candidatus Roizmanbacteria bacterium]
MRFKKLVEYFGSVDKAYEGNVKKIAEMIGEYSAKKFSTFRMSFDPVKKKKELSNKNIVFISQEDTKYPSQLKNIPDPPIGLYVKGDVEQYNFQGEVYIGIVGTRKPTSYGEQIAEKLSSELSTLGLVTISGMAMGIDSIVHKATLATGGKTIAVLGCGVDLIYPSCNAQLYRDILKNRGLIISEFPPGQRVIVNFFVLRNRLISGLSKGILVIEGMKDSGTLITARFAAEQGKEVFAIPSPITSPLSAAPNLLLKQGAKLVTCVEDIIEELGLSVEIQTKQSDDLNDTEKMIRDILQKEPKSVDELEYELHIPIGALLQRLTILEIKRIIEKNKEGKYQNII